MRHGEVMRANTPPDARRKWQTWVKKAAAKLTFSDPVFSVVVGRQKSIVRVRRGRSRVVASTGTVGIHSGMCFGASFWKKKPPSIPSG